MNVAVICEFSGVVRDAFSRLGHNAVSFDILPTEMPGCHVQGDVRKLPADYWTSFDLAICHPPCTFLSVAAMRVWDVPGRAVSRKEAMEFFMWCVNLPIEKICVENPVGYPNMVYRKPDQIIHPYFFGEPVMKKTCLWLKGLSPLYYDCRNLVKPEPVYIKKNGQRAGKRINFVESAKQMPGVDRWKVRSKTFLSIANQMAAQWGQSQNLEQVCLF